MVTGDVTTTARTSPCSDISTIRVGCLTPGRSPIGLRHGLTALESARRPSPRKKERSAVTTLRPVLCVFALVVAISTGHAQTPATNPQPRAPDFSVQIWGDIAADFSERVWSYFTLRRELEKGLPALMVTDDPADIRRAERALAKKIRVARAEAKPGDIFTPPISVEFRKMLVYTMSAGTWAAIMDDNPGAFSHRINSSYPKNKPVSTVPPSILGVLPSLPADIQYRFLGRHLILHDTRANVIVDDLRDAISCVHCDELNGRR
jgi:hypothetical protein